MLPSLVTHLVDKFLITYKGTNLRSIEDTSLDFVKRQFRKSRNYMLKTLTIIIQCLHKLLHQAEFYVKWGKTIFSRLTMGSCTMFGMPAFKVSWIGHSFWVQCFSRSRLSHMQRCQGYFVKPLCWPRRKLTILRSTKRIQLCS